MPRPAPPKSVLLVGNFLSRATGTRNVCEDLAPRLDERGWDVVTASPHAPRARRFADMLHTAWRARHRYRVAAVDVFSGPAFGWAAAVCRLLRALGKPCVLTLRGGNLPAFAQRKPHAVRRLLGGAAAVTTPSAYLYEHMAPWARSLELLPNPLDLPRYPFRPRTTAAPRLVWLRAFEDTYNPPLAVAVLARLKDAFPAVSLAMIGPDKRDGSLEATRRAAADLGVADRLEIPGAVPNPEVPRWLDRGDVFLNTTNVDNTPVSVLEAMACGLCVVSTNVGGIPYLLAHERDALLVPPADADAMAAAVRRLVSDPALATALSRHARAKTEGFGWRALLPRWERLLLEAAASGRPPGVACGAPAGTGAEEAVR